MKTLLLFFGLAMSAGAAKTSATSESPCIAGYHASGDTPFICLKDKPHKKHPKSPPASYACSPCTQLSNGKCDCKHTPYGDFTDECCDEGPTHLHSDNDNDTFDVITPIAPQKAPDPCDGVGCWGKNYVKSLGPICDPQNPGYNGGKINEKGECVDGPHAFLEDRYIEPGKGDYAGEPEQFTQLGSGNDKCSWDEECTYPVPSKAAVPVEPHIIRSASFHNCSEANPKDYASAFCKGTEVPEGCKFVRHHEPTGEEGYECPEIVEHSYASSDGSKVVLLSDSEYIHLQQLRTSVVEEEVRLAQKYGADIFGQGCSERSDPKMFCYSIPYRAPDHYEYKGQFLWIERAK